MATAGMGAGTERTEGGCVMSTFLFAVAALVAWFVLGLAAALVMGPMLRARDEERWWDGE